MWSVSLPICFTLWLTRDENQGHQNVSTNLPEDVLKWNHLCCKPDSLQVGELAWIAVQISGFGCICLLFPIYFWHMESKEHSFERGKQVLQHNDEISFNLWMDITLRFQKIDNLHKNIHHSIFSKLFLILLMSPNLLFQMSALQTLCLR